MRSDEACLQVVNTNYTAAVLALNHLMLRMEKRGSGTIAGISSVAGERGRMSNFIYGSAKAGLTAYLSGLRNRGYHTGVHVITVKPGFIRTAMTAGLPLPQPLTAEPEQVASDIVRAIKRKKNVIYSLWFWKYIMWLIRNIPEGVFMRRKL